ncbi:MAG: nucleotidyl transferase AbiEii/AbiGii toxin family protein [Myxococcales bacterium]|nr:nucleotidyl transferase AbiEii/AbiGii toxin family protein [Myxococcales bacterium]
MTPAEALVDIAARLRHHGVGFALVGGLAVSIRAEVRFTRDVDIAVAFDTDEEVERLARAMTAEGFSPVAVVEHKERGRLAIVRMRSPSGVVVDLLAASSGIEREIVDAAKPTAEFAGVPVATAEHLLAMKVLSMRDARLQDRIDARGLLASGTLDLVEVRRVLGLITARGFARGQDLEGKLAALLAESPRVPPKE